MSELRALIEDWYETKLLGELEFVYACYDERIQWDTWNVIGSVYGTDRCVLGQSDSNEF